MTWLVTQSEILCHRIKNLPVTCPCHALLISRPKPGVVCLKMTDCEAWFGPLKY